MESTPGVRGRHIDPRPIPQAMGEHKILALILVARHPNRGPKRMTGEIVDRGRHFGRKLLVVAADLPLAGQSYAGSDRRPLGFGQLENVPRRLLVFLGPPGFARPVGAMRQEFAGRNAQGIQREEHPLVLSFGVLIARQADLQRVLTGQKIDVGQLQPGDFAEETQFHQVRGQLVGGDLLPGPAVDPPLQRSAGELEADARPHLPAAASLKREGVRYREATGGDFLLDFVGLGGEDQPVASRKEMRPPGAAHLHAVGHCGRLLALQPDIVGRRGCPGSARLRGRVEQQGLRRSEQDEARQKEQ